MLNPRISCRHVSFHRPNRRGATLVLAVCCLIVIMAFSALVVDIGYLNNARVELQRSADAAALAACWEMGLQYANGKTTQEVSQLASQKAVSFAGLNPVTNSAPLLEMADFQVGYMGDMTQRNAPLDTSDPNNFNAVEVRLRRTAQTNGQVRTFFARALGIAGVDAQADARAIILRDIVGFEIPSDGSNLNILPFALDVETWNALLAGSADDNWLWNPDARQVQVGSDSILEVNLYPQNTGSPGNRGTVDIGGSNNSTSDIARQIVYGISPSDMAAVGGSLEFDSDGELTLNGDTGISAGVKDELASIIGETRIIPIFNDVQGPGNNADYTIIKWVGVRILDVKLTGPKNKKRLIVQPAPVAASGIIPGPTTSGTSDYVQSKAFLVY